MFLSLLVGLSVRPLEFFEKVDVFRAKEQPIIYMITCFVYMYFPDSIIFMIWQRLFASCVLISSCLLNNACLYVLIPIP